MRGCSRASVTTAANAQEQHMPNSVGRGEADYQESGNYIAKVGWCQQLLVRWGLIARQYFVTYVPTWNVKDAVTVVGAAT